MASSGLRASTRTTCSPPGGLVGEPDLRAVVTPISQAEVGWGCQSRHGRVLPVTVKLANQETGPASR